MIAFADLIDDALAIRKQLEWVLRQPIPVHILMDSKSLFDIITKRGRKSKKQIMLDINVALQAYNAKETKNKGFVRSSHSLADDPT